MKLYVHLASGAAVAEAEAEFTAVVNIGPAGTLDDVARTFVERLRRKQQQQQQQHSATDGFELVEEDSLTAPPLGPPTAKASAVLRDKQDVFARPKQQQKKPQHSSSSAAATTTTASDVETALKLIAEGRLRAARDALKAVLAADPRNPDALLHLGNILRNAGKYAEAEALLRTGVDAFPERADFRVCLGDTLDQSGDHSAAAESHAVAAALIQRALSESGRSEDGGHQLLEATLAKLGMALLHAGDDKKAMGCFSSVLARDRSHVPSLLGYAAVLARRSKAAAGGDDPELTAEALQVRLHVLVGNQKLQAAREGVAESLLAPSGVDALKKLLHGPASGDNAAAYAFVATVAKESGAFEQSLALYDIAMAQQPQSASYALNASHVCEALGWIGQAMSTLLRFFDANPALSVCGVSCKQVSDIMKPLAAHGIDPQSRPTAPDTTLAPGKASRSEQPQPQSAGPFTESELDLIAAFFALAKLLFVTGYLQFLQPLIDLIGKIFRPHSFILPPVPTNGVFFFKAHCREGRDLHLTTIRNEQAYFACIAQLVQDIVLPLDFALPSIYVVGDSHTLSCAWRTVDVGGTKYLLRPFLVTGLKIWHLREGSNFYPKHNFLRIVEQSAFSTAHFPISFLPLTSARPSTTVPKGSLVVMLLGEIDCREGLLAAMEKCRYESLEDGARGTIAIYKRVLNQLKQEHAFRLLVHPPVPVLDVTRSIIRIFDTVLRDELSALPSAKLLDIADKLVAPEWAALRPEFALDGTHLRSTYVPSVLEPAIADALQQQKP